ncbi:TonB-dependent receptor domain-containing protein [Kordiimonas gwangyangensis]|uniref:TonB-dependent receptor domain-containing protein n=1 Tax=Kordiimonas gwangyangensis TaxID=288022 RepID=UPI000470E5EF|nr:TonB-dependent receptor [Kordiimonas gwangyangensis]
MYGEGTFKAYAAFADVTYAVTDRFNVNAGVRYTRDEKSWEWYNGRREISGYERLDIPGVGNLADIHQQILTGIFQQFLGPTASGDIVFDVGGLEGVHYTRKDSWDDLSPRVAIDYQFSDDAMFYASYARGYKAGGFNSVEVNSYFDNEKVWNIEAGIKSQWFDNRVRFNAAVWKYKYNDKQSIRLVDVDGASVPQYVTQNQDVSGKGLDVEMLWIPLAGLRFFANGGYQDITCTESCGDSAVGDPTGEPSTACPSVVTIPCHLVTRWVPSPSMRTTATPVRAVKTVNVSATALAAPLRGAVSHGKPVRRGTSPTRV